MDAVIRRHRNALLALCERYGVERLALFGSATSDSFDPASSDLDFVVSFADRSAGYADRYMDFAEALEQLFGRPVDLVTERSIRNPLFRQAVEDSIQSIYDRRGEEAPA